MEILEEPTNKSLTFNGKLDEREGLLAKRFVTKYLWMLTNRNKYVSVFSLRSFYNLAPVFAKICEEKEELSEFKIEHWRVKKDSHWELHFDRFAEAWPKISKELFKQITETEFSEKDQGNELFEISRFLFAVSLNETTTKNALDLVKTGNKAIIIYGPPGTSKTYEAKRIASALIKEYEEREKKEEPESAIPSNGNLSEEFQEKYDFGDKRWEERWKERWKEHRFANIRTSQKNGKSDVYDFVPRKGYHHIAQFHPSYCYQDFVGGIIPKISDSSQLDYNLEPGMFKRFCDCARQSMAESKGDPPPFVFIIDEINRAHLSSVFGELLYSLEYRDESINIPYFNEFLYDSNKQLDIYISTS